MTNRVHRPNTDSRSATPHEERKDELLDLLAHELRSPIAAIAAAGRVLDELLPSIPSPQRQRATRVLAIHARQVEIANRMVDDLLDVRRLRAGKLVLRRADVDLAPIVRDAAEAHRAGVEAAGIALTVKLPSEPLTARVDAVRVEQIVANLLSNAAKYTSRGGHIEVELRREASRDFDARAALDVRDDGAGIPADELGLVFERYVRLGHTREHGLGIGLSLVRQLTALHGGDVSVWSAGEGAGSTFTVHLPLVDARSGVHLPLVPRGWMGAPTQEDRATLEHRLSPGLVLLVEDDADLRELLRYQLELGGCEVIEATNAEEALALARVRRPRVALIDLGLPTLGGLSLAQRLRADPDLPGLRLVAMSGYGGSGARRRSKEAGFVAHLVKPIMLDALKRELATED